MDGTYAPQSPDLSGFQSSPSKQPHLYQPVQHQQLHHQQLQQQSQQAPHNTSYAPQSPIIPSFNQGPAPQYASTNAYQETHLQPPHPHQAQLQNPYSFPPSGFGEYGSSTQYMPAIPALPATHSFHAPPTTSTPSYLHPPTFKQEDPQQQQQQYSPFDGTAEYAQPPHSSSPTMTSRGRPRVKGEVQHHSLTSTSTSASVFPPPQAYKNPNPLNIEIRTKFPVARIKRIMQADEEVGKVAQVTPVAVNKALELFMIALVTGAADKAREKGGKRVTAQHLKSVVEGDETFDFLKDIVERVADVQENAGGEGRKRKGAAGKAERDGGSESEVEEKPKKGKGRRKKE